MATESGQRLGVAAVADKREVFEQEAEGHGREDHRDQRNLEDRLEDDLPHEDGHNDHGDDPDDGGQPVRQTKLREHAESEQAAEHDEAALGHIDDSG